MLHGVQSVGMLDVRISRFTTLLPRQSWFHPRQTQYFITIVEK